MALIDQIVAAFEALGGVAHYSDLYAYLEKNAVAPLPRTWKASVRARIEENSPDSQAFKGKRELFYAVQGLGNGVWGLIRALEQNQLAVDIEEPDFGYRIGDGDSEPEKVNVEITRYIRDTKMTKQLKALYQFKCQVCDKTLHLYNRYYAEAHHLRPLGGSHHGTDDAGNILVVCPNHHVEFDYGAIAIHPTEMTIVHIERNYSLIGKQVSFHHLHRINELNLAYHIDNVYMGE